MHVVQMFYICCLPSSRSFHIGRTGSPLCGLLHTVWARGACVSAGARAAAAAHCVLELSGQRRGHPVVFLPGQQLCGRVQSRGLVVSGASRQGSAANRWVCMPLIENNDANKSDTGFHLSASVSQTPRAYFNVAVTFDRRRISSCNCTCTSSAYWCSHVVAVCLHRIHCVSMAGPKRL